MVSKKTRDVTEGITENIRIFSQALVLAFLVFAIALTAIISLKSYGVQVTPRYAGAILFASLMTALALAYVWFTRFRK